MGIVRTNASEATRTVGRPSSYSPELADTICQLIASGQSLLQICKKPQMPDRETVRKWQIHDAEFSANIARARKAQQEVFADQILEIAENATEDDWQARKFLVNTIQWHMSKVAPKEWGDKTQVTNGDGDGPMELIIRRVGG